MFPSTYVVRGAPAGRCAARRGHHHARGLSGGPGFFPSAVFGSPRHHQFFGPPAHRGRGDVFDHFDDFVNRSLEGLLPAGPWNANRGRGADNLVWQPRFDVKEVDGAYQLRGELPGVDAKDLDVEFTNANTLVIRGQTQTERTEAQQPQPVEATPQQDGQDAVMSSAENAAQGQEAADKDDVASVHSESSYVQPTVEDEADQTRRESVGTDATADAPGAATPQTDNAVAQPQQEQQPQSQQPRYWVSERSTGSFSRSFEFPGRVDADGVTASLKNGILDVTVPKAKAPEARKISVL